jgi:succinate dehydrogenase / fumarate reductase cytochrome b subunit
MKWIADFLMSSLGKKLIMSLTGLFLCLFLVVHMLGNLQLFLDTDGEAFNLYAYQMTHNPIIKIIAYGNYFFILLHAVQGILITTQNRKSKGIPYQGKQTADTQAKLAAKNMRNLGLLILVFFGLHMWQFWAQMKFFTVTEVTYGDQTVKDLYTLVRFAFSEAWVCIFYLISLAALALHLFHGFWSAFQTMGLMNKKYSPFIRGIALVYAIFIPLGFATMPVVFFFMGAPQ